jgi:hypothetical protein
VVYALRRQLGAVCHGANGTSVGPRRTTSPSCSSAGPLLTLLSRRDVEFRPGCAAKAGCWRHVADGPVAFARAGGIDLPGARRRGLLRLAHVLSRIGADQPARHTRDARRSGASGSVPARAGCRHRR